jgi:hypothetical protein
MSGATVTSKTRPANPVVGQMIYESDTMMDRRWDGTYWEIIRWYGSLVQGRASAGPNPIMNRSNTAFTIANEQWIDVNSWSVTNLPSGVMTTASTSGGPLFTTDGTYTYTQEKGRVRMACHIYGDNGAAHEQDLILISPNNGAFGSYTDRRISPSGFAGAGSLEGWVTIVADCLPGDKFGLGVHAASNPASNQTLQVHMQLFYL